MCDLLKNVKLIVCVHIALFVQGAQEKYFIPGGFAVTQANSVTVSRIQNYSSTYTFYIAVDVLKN